jgi:hypothetical protein
VRADGLARASRLPARDGAACVQLGALGPGMLAGDRFVTHGTVAPGAVLLVRGQMATPVYAGGRAAGAEMRWTVDDGGTLVVVGQPVLPERGSVTELRVELDVRGSGCAIVAETLALAPGATVRASTIGRCDGTLGLRDVVAIDGDTVAAGAVGTLVALSGEAPLRERFSAAAWALLDADGTVRGGVGGTAHALVVRLRGGTFAVAQATAALADALLAIRMKAP